jgi:Tol biopolymer transport system component
MKNNRILICFVYLALLMPAFLWGQFGKNKVQYEQFEWNYIQSAHFDIFYTDDNKALAEFAATEAEKAYMSIKQLLNWPLQKRYTVIVYDSHNAFQQTNVIYEYMPEGVGGVTELFKNRVVVPFDGSYRDLRHVLHHELVHAVMNDMYYGGNIQSLVSGSVTLQIPGWLAEGTCEYESLRWDVQTDMFMRDYAFNGNFVPMEYLSGYYTYKAGQSIFRFIDEVYGYEKLTEFYTSLKSTHNVNRSIQRVFKMDSEELNKAWYQYLKKEFWPDIELADQISKMAVQLTDHIELGNSQNVSPAISPSGSEIIFMSDRNGYADIFKMKVEDGSEVKKIVGGQRKASLEELKWLSPGISWSSDSKHFVFAAKSGRYDALIIVNSKTKRQRVIPMKELKGVFSAAWHPKKDIIAFEGNTGTQSDIFIYDIRKKTLVNLTNDSHADKNPAWSPDGKKLIYVSERERISHYYPERHPMQYDLYEIDLNSRVKRELTHTDWDENYPVYDPNGRGILFVSDESGIQNIYVKKWNHDPYPISNILGGIYHLDLDRKGQTLVFSAFEKGGWDIYRMSKPFEKPPLTLKKTNFRQTEQTLHTNPRTAPPSLIKNQADSSGSRATIHQTPQAEINENYNKFVFMPQYRDGISSAASADTVQLDSVTIMTAEGDYFDYKYKTKFSLDLVDSQMGYSTFYGFQGMAAFLFSDVLGDHQIAISTELYIDLKNSDYALSYYYLKRRTNFGFSYFNYSDHYYTYYMGGIAITHYRNYGMDFVASYPLNRYQRFDYNQSYFVASRELLNAGDFENPTAFNYSINTAISSFSYVFDNVLWSYTAPMDGMRYRLQYDYVPSLGEQSPTFNTLSLDFRKYWKVDFDYHFMARASAGTSWGKNQQNFMIGGIDNWLNYRYNPEAPIFGSSSGNFTDQMDVYYFSRFITPVRGVRYFEKSGGNYFLFNFELRYPFIEYARLRFPLPINLYQVRGVWFTDIGSAWSGKLQPYRENGILPFGNHYEDLVSSTGFGLRIFLGYFLLRTDIAWEYDGNGFSKPRYLFSIGGDL